MHVLERLTLPDRYERLVETVGTDVAKLLLPPPPKDESALKLLAMEVRTRREGLLVPIFALTGTGKTTFVNSLGQWMGADFGPTLNYENSLDAKSLNDAMAAYLSDKPKNFQLIVPLNIDHRESAPPSDTELSAIKRFLRTGSGGALAVIFWPEINHGIAQKISSQYTSVSGMSSIDLPLALTGIDRSEWRDIARHTLSVVNKIDNLSSLGVDPSDYDVNEFETLGSFLRRISADFNANIYMLRQQIERPVSLVIAFVSETNDPGVLSQLTSPSYYGLLDAHALVSVTANSVIGKWWQDRRGLLTRAIVQLNVRAISLPPTAAASCVRNMTDSMPLFDKVGYRRYGPARAVRDLSRSDLGKIVIGEKISRFEARGTPPDDARAAFALLSETGFNLGKDKKLNQVMSAAITALLEDQKISFEKVEFEKKLPFCSLIPDNSVYHADGVTCIEYTWRTGDFLVSRNRSVAAQYILGKLQNYVRELGWTVE